MRSDRWSHKSEVKRELCVSGENNKGGLVLDHSNGKNWVYPGEGHSIILGVSGSGKSRRGTIPLIKSLIKAGESFVAIDPKGEIHYHTAADAEDGYDIHVVDFRHIFESERWNLLAAPDEHFVSGDSVRKQIALEMIDELAHTLYPVSDKADPFWPESARSVFIGATYALMMLGKPEQVNMAGVYQLIAKGEERMGGSTVLKEFVDSLPTDSVAAMLLQSYISTANDTRAGIRSTFLEGLSMFARSDGLISMLGADDLHINDLDGEKPTAIYIILPDESPIFDSIAGVLCSQIMGHYIRLAQDKYNGKLPRRLNVCLEELGNIGKSIRSLAHLMTAGRSRNIRCHLVLQSLSQLDTLYGPSEASTIRSNADVLLAFRTNHWDTLSELSHKCGEREVDGHNHVSRESLITPSQLASMKTGQALVMISGHTKFITWLPDFTEMFDCSNWKAPKRIVRKSDAKVEVFNIKAYVEEVKKKRLRSSIKEDSVPVPERFIPMLNEPPFGSLSGPTDEDQESEEILFDIGSFIAQIDELKAEETAKKAEGECVENKKASGQEVVILTAGSSKLAMIKVIRDHAKVTHTEAKEIIGHLPYTVRVSTEEESSRFINALAEAGSIAIPKIATPDEDE